jgi:hypothetical protein
MKRPECLKAPRIPSSTISRATSALDEQAFSEQQQQQQRGDRVQHPRLVPTRGIDPLEYLRDVLPRMTRKIRRLDLSQLLPSRWAAARAAAQPAAS